MMNKNNKTNIIASLLMIFFMFLFLIISGRFIYIQATGEVSDVSLNEWANDKRETSIVLQADRGKILDQDGKTLMIMIGHSHFPPDHFLRGIELDRDIIIHFLLKILSLSGGVNTQDPTDQKNDICSAFHDSLLFISQSHAVFMMVRIFRFGFQPKSFSALSLFA